MHVIRHLISIAYGLPFVIIGIGHFRNPEWFEPIVPDLLGAPRFWVLVSGVFEILLGLLIFFPRTRRIASIGFVGMLFALYWANINMWINDIEVGGTRLSQGGHVLRGFIQIILIATAAWIGGLIPIRRLRNI